MNLRSLAAVGALVARAIRLGAPPFVATADRLRNIPTDGAPLQAPATIHWDRHQTPSIEAQSEPDLAVALGIVHAHLRLAQMEIMRRLATGRVAEVIGPVGIELDRSLRLMGYARTARTIADMLPGATRAWAEGFVAGVNHHIAHAAALPHEFALLDARPAPWTLHDLLAVGRLAATDVSWLVFARLLRDRAAVPAPTWNALWPLLQQGDSRPLPQTMADEALGLVHGSNCFAAPAACAAHGAGLLAADPHLGILSPPLWLQVALHAPGLDAAGLMIPGLPLLAVGRNRHIAWGGTNLHAQSSDLIDVADEPMSERMETIHVRGAGPAQVRLRETRFGPVVSDGILLPSASPISLRWVGSRPSDEMTALLGVMRADSFEAFQAALRGFAVPGQTMLAVEAGPHGRAGRVIAAHLPRRPAGPMPALTLAPGQAWDIDDLAMGADASLVGVDVQVSANERPTRAPAPVGYFFSAPDRAERLARLIVAPVTPEMMAAAQRDVMQPSSLPLRDALLRACPAPGRRQAEAWQALSDWDGAYATGSRGALVFELMVGALARRVVPPDRLRVLGSVFTTRAMTSAALERAPAAAVVLALRHAARGLRRWRDWGGVHRLGVAHPLSRLPVVGRRYRMAPAPVAGSNETLAVTGHGPVRGRHAVTFGACARFLADLGDEDANDILLLGGNDGWLGSENATDHVPLWRAGQTIRVPLNPAPARAWPHRTDLRP